MTDTQREGRTLNATYCDSACTGESTRERFARDNCRDSCCCSVQQQHECRELERDRQKDGHVQGDISPSSSSAHAVNRFCPPRPLAVHPSASLSARQHHVNPKRSSLSPFSLYSHTESCSGSGPLLLFSTKRRTIFLQPSLARSRKSDDRHWFADAQRSIHPYHQ
ncbi:hypothetical protein MPTK1_3g18060 [Marchantia polymorpha subsp. ruderalis]|uniref:Uncharacterized protein n=2 Tax=Marchantia polymorpha TaxID=3197 RepID=A0AAF6B227_MARPO|nr:hypothetical protein MARPO_0140s0035 [Marchantia polymorpha]BBN06061.1 hypothetical protein Mp_3g18060 [Marchantia polymorpha subsp. ruderalis]|eukprot:PTQ29506.1 hypothetical protein MARPO_0140s0035 [Marchantia polymorpha]